MTGVPLVQPGVLEVVTDHVNSAWARKVGGILLGRALDDATRVDAALPARQTDEFAGEIAFPPPVWEEAYASLDEHPGSTIVGWYHSHPGSGVALSDYDRRLHKILFGEPFSVALVVDPVASRMAWFGWDIDQLWPLAGEAAPGPVSAAEPEPRIRAAVVAALVALGLVAGGVGGYWLERELRGPSNGATVRELQRQLDVEASQIDDLRSALDRARSELAAEQDRLRSAQAHLDATQRALAEAKRHLRELREARTLSYHLQVGDTLWDLARTFLGDPFRWPEILRANRDRIADPRTLVIGQTIQIPLR